MNVSPLKTTGWPHKKQNIRGSPVQECQLYLCNPSGDLWTTANFIIPKVDIPARALKV